VDLSSLDDSGTDDQNISGSGLSGTDLTIGIENGTNEVVDLSSLANTDEQDLSNAVITPNESVEIQITNGNNTTIDIRDADSDVTNELTLIGSGAPAVIPSNSGVTYVDDIAGQLYVYDGSTWNAVGGNATPDLDGDPTNEQNTAFAVNGTNLEITDSGGTLSVPLSSVGTDDQNLTLSGTDLSIEDGNTVDLSGFVSTDDQNIENLAVNTTTNILTVGIEDGTNQTVDLSHLDDAGTDDQNISGSGLSGTDLTIGIENGTNEVVDLSSLVGTDEQDLTNATLSGANILQIDIENGASTTVDLSSLDNSGTDDQNLTLTGTDLSIEDGNTVDLSGFVSTDDQNIESLAVNTTTNILTVGIEDGTGQTVDLSHLDDAGTDDQNISGSGLSGTDLTIGIENGTNEVVDLSSLV
jgi:uncharacterized protein YjbI with pentapeptide repeats